MAVNVGMMASYDQIKYMVVAARGGEESFATRVLCAGIAGFACAWTSLPFDRIKTSMQDMAPDAKVGIGCSYSRVCLSPHLYGQT
jgi:solute carrier family 25 oxoglutarate transporter 11